MFRIFALLLCASVHLQALHCETLRVKLGNDKWGMPVKHNYCERIVSFENYDELFEKIKASDLQKSLFYQGFLPEFFSCKSYSVESDYYLLFNEVPFDADLKNPVRPRDLKKAFEYAKIAFEKGDDGGCALAKINYANMYLSGIGVPKDISKAMEILKDNPLLRVSLEKLKNLRLYEYVLKAYPPLIAYLYYRGIGVERDLEKAKAILNLRNDIAWRNFYIGYAVPKDFEFAVFTLEIKDKFWAALTLADIYSGKYSKADIDKKKAKYWAKIAQSRLAAYHTELVKEWKEDVEKALKLSDYLKLAELYGFKKVYFTHVNYYTKVPFENPFYKPEEAQMYFEKYLKKASFDTIDDIKYFMERTRRIKGNSDDRIYEYEGEIFEEFERFYERI